MPARITRNMSFAPNRSLRKLADRVISAYPEHFGHIDTQYVAFLMETTGQESGAAAVCHRLTPLMESLLASYKHPTDWVIAFFSAACEGKSQQWMQLVMFHELLHIGVDGKLARHDVEDFAEVLQMAGIDWVSNDDDELPDIVRKKIRMVA